MKQLISLLLAIVVLMGMAPPAYASEIEIPSESSPAKAATSKSDEATAYAAASGTCGANLTWTLDGSGTLTISGTGPMADYGADSAPWHAHRHDIVKVVLREGVTSVGSYAFDNCYFLSDVIIPGSVTAIGDYAFSCCYELTTLSIPSGVVTIGECAFMGIHLTELVIPDSVQTIGPAAFWDCIFLSKVTIGKGVTTIGNQAFTNCYELTGITVDTKNTAYCHDAKGVLYDITKERLIRVPCKLAGSYSVPEGVISIGTDAFASCTALTSVTLPNTVTSIAFGAFSFCSGLTEITIPESVVVILGCAFGWCDGLTKINFVGDAPVFYDNPFQNVTATVFYPGINSTWTGGVMQNYGGYLTWIPVGVPGLTVPDKPYKIANVVSGAHVYWTAIPGIEKYGLWRSETGRNGEYKWIGNPTVPHFTDTKVESGKTYFYKVTTMNTETKQHSEMSPAIGITYVSTPDITSRFNKAAGISLGWNKIDGATGYAIYRKSYSGSDEWVRIATIPGNATFTWQDTSVKNSNGTIYRYTIRALAGSDMKTLSGCRNTGRTMARLTSRTLNSAVKAGDTSVKCQWTTSSAVTGYEVRFMAGNTVYKTFTVGNYKTGVKTFTGLQAGQTYKIQVRSYLKVDGMGFYSAWSEPINVTLP